MTPMEADIWHFNSIFNLNTDMSVSSDKEPGKCVI